MTNPSPLPPSVTLMDGIFYSYIYIVDIIVKISVRAGRALVLFIFLFCLFTAPSNGFAQNLSSSIWFVSKTTDNFTEEQYLNAIGVNMDASAGIMIVCNKNQTSLSGAVFKAERSQSTETGKSRTFVRTKVDSFPTTQSYWDSYISREAKISRVNPNILSVLIEQMKKGHNLSVQTILSTNETLAFQLPLGGSSNAIENVARECNTDEQIIHSKIPDPIAYNYFFDVLSKSNEEGHKAVIEQERANNKNHLASIMSKIKSRIEERWRIPLFSESSTENTVSVWFNYDGTIQNVEITSTSRDQLFDQSTLMAAKSLNGIPDFSDLSISFFKSEFQPLELKFRKP